MSISARLKEFRNSPSPSKTHAREIHSKVSAFSRKLQGLPSSPSGSASHSAGEPRELQYYDQAVRSFSKRMAEAGVFFSFSSEEGFALSGDIFHTVSVSGCPVTFITNTLMHKAGAPGVQPLPEGASMVAAYNPDSPHIPEQILVSADNAEMVVRSGMESRIAQENSLPMRPKVEDLEEIGLKVRTLHGAFSSSGLSDLEIIRMFCDNLRYSSTIGEEDTALLDAFLFDSLFHELGHMQLHRFFPASQAVPSLDELFSCSIALTVSKKPAFYFSEVINQAIRSLDEGEECHMQSSRIFTIEFNRFLKVEEFSPKSLLEVFPKYFCIPSSQINWISSKILNATCSLLGKKITDLPNELVEQAEGAIYG